MKCPTCGCDKFYVKDIEDEYEIYNFTARNGTAKFDSKLDSTALPEVTKESEAFCDRCAWHGKLQLTGGA